MTQLSMDFKATSDQKRLWSQYTKLAKQFGQSLVQSEYFRAESILKDLHKIALQMDIPNALTAVDSMRRMLKQVIETRQRVSNKDSEQMTKKRNPKLKQYDFILGNDTAVKDKQDTAVKGFDFLPHNQTQTIDLAQLRSKMLKQVGNQDRFWLFDASN